MMAQRVRVMSEDDVDGSEAQETISFCIDGSAFEIDLWNEHATALRSTLDCRTMQRLPFSVYGGGRGDPHRLV
jgi:Lsr2